MYIGSATRFAWSHFILPPVTHSKQYTETAIKVIKQTGVEGALTNERTNERIPARHIFTDTCCICFMFCVRERGIVVPQLWNLIFDTTNKLGKVGRSACSSFKGAAKRPTLSLDRFGEVYLAGSAQNFSYQLCKHQYFISSICDNVDWLLGTYGRKKELIWIRSNILWSNSV